MSKGNRETAAKSLDATGPDPNPSPGAVRTSCERKMRCNVESTSGAWSPGGKVTPFILIKTG